MAYTDRDIAQFMFTNNSPKPDDLRYHGYADNAAGRSLFMGRRLEAANRHYSPTPEALVKTCERLLTKHDIIMERFR